MNFTRTDVQSQALVAVGEIQILPAELGDALQDSCAKYTPNDLHSGYSNGDRGELSSIIGGGSSVRLVRWLARILLAVLAVAVMLNMARFDTNWTIWLGRGLALLLLLGAVCIRGVAYIQRVRQSSKARSIGEIPQVLPGRIHEIQRLAGSDSIQYWQARIFALAITKPEELNQRTIEYYLPHRRTLTQSVSHEIQIPRDYLPEMATALTPVANSETALAPEAVSGEPASGNTTTRALRPHLESMPFPVVVAPKGEVYDYLEICDESGRKLPTLAYREYLQLVANVIRALLVSAYSLQVGESLPTDAQLAENLAIQEIITRGSSDALSDTPVASTRAARIHAAVEKVRDLAEKVEGEKQAAISLAANLVERLATHFAIVASVETPLLSNGRFIVKYEHLVVPELQLADNGRSGFIAKLRGALRTILGTRPLEIGIELSKSWTCKSYHLSVQGPEGLYLAHQILNLDKNDAYLTKCGLGAPTPPYYRFRSRLGQSYAHFYGRYFYPPGQQEDSGNNKNGASEAKNPPKTPAVMFRFYEVPPGTDFQATIAALSGFTLIWLIGFVMSHAISKDLGSDAPVLLLAFPGVVASWMGFDTPRQRLFEGSMSARLSLALTAVTAVGASALFILDRSGIASFSHPNPWHVSVLGIQDIYWTAVSCLALVNVLVIGYRCLMRTLRYSSLATRPLHARE